MPALYLNTFRPLVGTSFGRNASEAHNLKPFLDCSIRREPDFEHSHPVITCICRAGKFAPRLAPGDVIVYLTVKGRFGLRALPHRRFVAVLEAKRTFDSHPEAAKWFVDHELPLPTNLIIRGNPPKPIAHSDDGWQQDTLTSRQRLSEWDRFYRDRVAENGRVVGCERKHVHLDWSAPIVTDRDLRAVFGYVPSTRNPGKHDIALFPRFLKRFSAHSAELAPPTPQRTQRRDPTRPPRATRGGCPVVPPTPPCGGRRSNARPRAS